jgi:hypothetical protein
MAGGCPGEGGRAGRARAARIALALPLHKAARLALVVVNVGDVDVDAVQGQAQLGPGGGAERGAYGVGTLAGGGAVAHADRELDNLLTLRYDISSPCASIVVW